MSCERRDITRPVFVATWFLDVNRLHLCVRPRRVAVSSSISFEEFKAACNVKWYELLDGRSCQFYIVEGEPAGLPSTIAHAIVVQGCHEGYNVILVHGQGLPPLFSFRTILYTHASSVQDVFRIAQFPHTCEGDNYRCCLQFSSAGQRISLEDGQRAEIRLAKLVDGCVRPLQNSDVDTSSGESTDVPDSDDDVGDVTAFWTMSWNTPREKSNVWSWHRLKDFKDGDQSKSSPPRQSRLLTMLSRQDGKEANSDLLWSWQCHIPSFSDVCDDGGEANLDLTWSDANQDESGRESCYVPAADETSSYDDGYTWCRHVQVRNCGLSEEHNHKSQNNTNFNTDETGAKYEPHGFS